MAETAKKRPAMGTDFTSGAVMPLLLRFFLPFLLANLLNSLYNTIDTMIIGQFVGSSGIVAVSLGGKMLNLFTNIGLALAGGGQILISQLLGAKRRGELNSTIGTLFSEMMVLSVLFAVATLLLSRNIITWLNTQDEAFDGALAYLRITCIGLPLLFGYNAVSSVLRGMGDSTRPLIFIAIAAAFNLVGDVVFIVCFGLGVAGTALATVLGQGLSLVFSIVFLYRRRARFGFDFRLRSFAIDWRKLWIMCRLGFPAALRSFCITGTQLVMMGYVNLFGLAAAAAYSIGDKIYHLANIFATSVMQAGGSMIAQNFGAGKPERVQRIVRCSFALTLAAAVVLSVPSLLFPEAFFGLFDHSADVLVYAQAFMAISSLIYFLSAAVSSYEAVMQGTGNAMLSMIGGILDGVVLRVGLSFVFAYGLGLGVIGFFLADALSRLAPLVLGGVYYHSGAWKRRKTLVSQSDGETE
ncbi:MAG: MATE family efflux transporter [Oscillospiraceae bacterium]|nr:MATE family efflux transporter [Oscillospiraceae bacterium]